MSERFLTIDEVVENAMISLDDQNSRDRIVFRQWAYLALRQLGFSDLDICTECVDVCDLSFSKPDNLASTIDVSLVGSDGFSYRYEYVFNNGHLQVDANTINRLAGNACNIMLSEDNDFYHLSSNATNIIQAQIKYYGFPVDGKGDPKIQERDLLAIMSFIEFMYVKRNRVSDKTVSNSDIELFRDIWQREMMKAKGRRKMPSMLQGAKIAKSWMSMIQKCNYKAS